MKKFLNIITIAAVIFSLSSCAVHSGLTSNTNSSTTKVVLQGDNYKIVQQVQGKASGIVVLGFGGSFNPLIADARSKMLESADLIGKSRAVINETVEVNDKIFVVCKVKTVTVSAYVVEFTGAASTTKASSAGTTNASSASAEKKKAVIQTEEPAFVEYEVTDNSGFEYDIEFESDTEFNTTTNTNSSIVSSNNTATSSAEIAQRPAETGAIAGRWSRENDGLVITISGNVGTLTQVTSGFWQRLVDEGRVSIGSQIFRNFTKIDNTTWRVQELVVGPTTSNWRSTTISVNAAGNVLTIGNAQNGYTLTR